MPVEVEFQVSDPLFVPAGEVMFRIQVFHFRPDFFQREGFGAIVVESLRIIAGFVSYTESALGKSAEEVDFRKFGPADCNADCNADYADRKRITRIENGLRGLQRGLSG